MLFKIETYYDPIDGYSECEDYEYEIDNEKMERAVLDIIYEKYFKKLNIDKKEFKRCLNNFIKDTCLDINEDWEEIFYDQLVDYFYEEAREKFFS